MGQVKACWTDLGSWCCSHLVPVDVVGVVVKAVAGVDRGGPVGVRKQYCLQQQVRDQARLPLFRVLGFRV